MKKIFLIIIFCLFINNVYAIENITIDNESIIPSFDKNIYVYNYFTNKDQVYINVSKKEAEKVSGDGIVNLNDYKTKVIIKNDNKEYKINIFKNYDKDKREESYVKNIYIDGYNLNFNKNTYEYSIYIGDEDFLDIDCEMSNVGDYYIIEGNGNFNKSDNIITIKTDNSEYIIHAYKSIKVSKIEQKEIIKEMSVTKKEIVKITIITISCILVVSFYYLLFINKTIYHI